MVHNILQKLEQEYVAKIEQLKAQQDQQVQDTFVNETVNFRVHNSHDDTYILTRKISRVHLRCYSPLQLTFYLDDNTQIDSKEVIGYKDR